MRRIKSAITAMGVIILLAACDATSTTTPSQSINQGGASSTATSTGLGSVAVTLTAYTSSSSEGSYASPPYYECDIIASVNNTTQYHLTRAEVGWEYHQIPSGDADTNLGFFQIPEVTANSSGAQTEYRSRVDAGSPLTCEAQAREYERRQHEFHVSTCEMPNLSEGDCQRLVSLSTNFDYQAIAQEDRQQQAALQPQN